MRLQYDHARRQTICDRPAPPGQGGNQPTAGQRTVNIVLPAKIHRLALPMRDGAQPDHKLLFPRDHLQGFKAGAQFPRSTMT
jgi:hypothetical protein